jgi:hypothetical protein
VITGRVSDEALETFLAHEPMKISHFSRKIACRCGNLTNATYAQWSEHVEAELRTQREQASGKAQENPNVEPVEGCLKEYSPLGTDGAIHECRLPAGHLGQHHGEPTGRYLQKPVAETCGAVLTSPGHTFTCRKGKGHDSQHENAYGATWSDEPIPPKTEPLDVRRIMGETRVPSLAQPETLDVLADAIDDALEAQGILTTRRYWTEHVERLNKSMGLPKDWGLRADKKDTIKQHQDFDITDPKHWDDKPEQRCRSLDPATAKRRCVGPLGHAGMHDDAQGQWKKGVDLDDRHDIALAEDERRSLKTPEECPHGTPYRYSCGYCTREMEDEQLAEESRQRQAKKTAQTYEDRRTAAQERHEQEHAQRVGKHAAEPSERDKALAEEIAQFIATVREEMDKSREIVAEAVKRAREEIATIRTSSAPKQCGKHSMRWDIDCQRNPGHAGKHGSGGIFWEDALTRCSVGANTDRQCKKYAKHSGDHVF